MRDKMRYQVLWQEEAEEALLEIWATAEDSAVVAEAANQLNALLANDPESAGESRGDRGRIVFVRPLAAMLEVNADALTVVVTRVWQFKS
jgi:hypothetical protein